jgi:hypothetical protein
MLVLPRHCLRLDNSALPRRPDRVDFCTSAEPREVPGVFRIFCTRASTTETAAWSYGRVLHSVGSLTPPLLLGTHSHAESNPPTLGYIHFPPDSRQQTHIMRSWRRITGSKSKIAACTQWSMTTCNAELQRRQY